MDASRCLRVALMLALVAALAADDAAAAAPWEDASARPQASSPGWRAAPKRPPVRQTSAAEVVTTPAPETGGPAPPELLQDGAMYVPSVLADPFGDGLMETGPGPVISSPGGPMHGPPLVEGMPQPFDPNLSGACGPDDCAEGPPGPNGWGYGPYWNRGFELPGFVPWGALIRNFEIFAGLHGFKGSLDRGRNGNFGFHEGVNFGTPLGLPWNIGGQVGLRGVQSNFSGNQALSDAAGIPLVDSGGRDQVFVTAGLFSRGDVGQLLGGVVIDYIHDNFYANADLIQLRSETSLELDPINEIGYWGAYGVSSRRLDLSNGLSSSFQPTDMFTGFYRRHFSFGGHGRIWGGATGSGDGVLGGEIVVPLGVHWSLENNFTYLIPKHGGAAGQAEEAWAMGLQLVFYPGRSSRCAVNRPFAPMFDVADNSVFILHRDADLRTRNP